MSVTVFVNVRSVAHKGAGGKAICMSPDVCKTPAAPTPLPIPYPNIAQDSDGADGSSTVKCDGSPVLLKSSKFSTSTGDEAGSIGGVVSSKFKGSAKFITYSFDVKIEGQSVCRHLDMTLMNGNAFNDNGTYTCSSGTVMKVPAKKDFKKKCMTAKKLLKDFPDRIREKANKSAQAQTQAEIEITKLLALKKSISFANIPWTDSVFPGEWEHATLAEIEELCAAAR